MDTFNSVPLRWYFSENRQNENERLLIINRKVKLISRYRRKSISVVNPGWENIPSELQILEF